jgi:hypothetical protein
MRSLQDALKRGWTGRIRESLHAFRLSFVNSDPNGPPYFTGAVAIFAAHPA